MSGVEAIFGVISGGAGLVSLGIQLGESAMKLKRIFSAAKNAPKTISKHIFSLETMAIALQQLEQHRQHDTHSGALLARCIMECRESTSQIQQLVDKMEHYMTSYDGVRGKLYTVYKEREVKELFDDLERAKNSLELAYMVYLAEEQRRRDQAHSNTLALHGTLLSGLQAQVLARSADISQQLTGLLQSPTVPHKTQLAISDSRIAVANEPMLTGEVETNMGEMSSSPGYLKQYGRPFPVRQVRRKSNKTHLRIRLPSIVYSRVWEFAITSAQSGWSMHLHTYNTVPLDSLIFRYCELGNIAAMQRLIASGEGSLLDTQSRLGLNENWTLLEAAADCGQLEVCRYLLNQIDWPDHTAVLSRALGWFALVHDGKNSLEMYRLFLEAPGFDVDLEDIELYYTWLHKCHNTECLYLILGNLHPRFFSLSVEARFDFVVRFTLRGSRIDTSGFLKCIGLRQSDQKLASLRSSSGESVLHCIAHNLWNYGPREFATDELRRWLDLGINVLKNGADPCCIPRRTPSLEGHGVRNLDPHPSYQRKLEWQGTPLMDALGIVDWVLWLDHPHGIAGMLRIIQIWAWMLQQADLDLDDYGDKESKIWKSLGIEDFSNTDQTIYPSPFRVRVRELIYGPTPANWSLAVQWPLSIYIFKLHLVPGAFSEKRDLPTTIIWDPTEEERNEGPWKIAEKMIIQSKSRDLRDLVVEPREPFRELVNSVQDDLGAIILMQYRASRLRGSASRSHSQPRLMRHRRKIYDENRGSDLHLWLEIYHLCPFDSAWRLAHREGRWNGVSCDPRNCVEGISNGPHSVQESYSWQYRSYLGYIAGCQDGYTGSYYSRGRRLARNMRHTGTRSCPQGCGKVHLDRIQVPEALRPFHPKRRYGEDLMLEGDGYEES